MWNMDKEFDDEGEVSSIPVTTLYRWYLYDMCDESPNKHIDIFGITPVSEEGDAMERESSDERFAAIAPLIPFLKLYAKMNAHYIFENQREELLQEGVTPEQLEANEAKMKGFYGAITMSGLTTALSTAAELGIIKVEDVTADIGEKYE